MESRYSRTVASPAARALQVGEGSSVGGVALNDKLKIKIAAIESQVTPLHTPGGRGERGGYETSDGSWIRY